MTGFTVRIPSEEDQNIAKHIIDVRRAIEAQVYAERGALEPDTTYEAWYLGTHEMQQAFISHGLMVLENKDTAALAVLCASMRGEQDGWALCYPGLWERFKDCRRPSDLWKDAMRSLANAVGIGTR